MNIFLFDVSIVSNGWMKFTIRLGKNKFEFLSSEAFVFDARIIILPKEKMKDYFHSRQAFAMAAFMNRVCSFYQLSVEKRTVAYVKTALKERGLNWNDFPQYVCSGYVGFENEKWEVETASDFS